MTLDRGTVVLVELDPTVGREQRGVRPCIAVSDPSVNTDQRFPLIAVVPVTAEFSPILLRHKVISIGSDMAPATSCVLVDADQTSSPATIAATVMSESVTFALKVLTQAGMATSGQWHAEANKKRAKDIPPKTFQNSTNSAIYTSSDMSNREV